MKRCETLAAEPPGLAAFRVANPTATNWVMFRNDHHAAFRELADALEARQRGICAFCENRLVTPLNTQARQIEHWRPKAQGGAPAPEITFGIDNLHAACLGGANPHLPPPFGFSGLAGGDTLSCGQRKGEEDPALIALAQRPYRPTELPVSPSAFIFDMDGMISPNPAMAGLGFDLDRLAITITFLGLNCDRLRYTRQIIREELLHQLGELEASSTEADLLARTRSAMAALAMQFRAIPGAQLLPFISLIRDFLGPACEPALFPDNGWEVG